MVPSAVAAVVALVALFAFAPLASATSDPLASGTTTITLNKGLVNKLKKVGVKVLKASPATVKGRTVTLPVSGGSVDPTTGQGTVEHSGGIKFKRGKKTAPVNTFVLDTTTSSLNAKVAGKTMKLASVSGVTFARNGFGVNVSIGKLKLTGKAAKQLNKKLSVSGKSKGKASKLASVSKGKAAQKPFKGNQVLGSSASETQPKTVAVAPTGSASLALSASAVQKLNNVGPHAPGVPGPFAVKLGTIPPTSASPTVPPVLTFPISGGTMSPTATSGVLQTAGGVTLTQDLELAPPPGTFGTTTLTMGNIWVDLSAKTATVEVIITNPKLPPANLGNLGRSSIADIQLTGATIIADPAARTISVQNATATLQAVTAETLNAVFINEIEKATMTQQEKFAGGDPLGIFSFTAQTQ